MIKENYNKQPSDIDVKRKAVKLVIVHLKKKLTREFMGSEYVKSWIVQMDELLSKPDFSVIECMQMRKRLNDVIESTLDEEIRFKLRDSWYSFGKALDKKVKLN